MGAPIRATDRSATHCFSRCGRAPHMRPVSAHTATGRPIARGHRDPRTNDQAPLDMSKPIQNDDVGQLAGLQIMCRFRVLDCRLDQRQVTDRSVFFGPGRVLRALAPQPTSRRRSPWNRQRMLHITRCAVSVSAHVERNRHNGRCLPPGLVTPPGRCEGCGLRAVSRRSTVFPAGSLQNSERGRSPRQRRPPRPDGGESWCRTNHHGTS
jgi:hypothetical protein